MTIAHVTYGLGMGGIESILVNISHFQAQQGHEVHIVVINDIVDASLAAMLDPAVRLHLLGRKEGSKNPWHVIKLNSCLRRINPDVIHLHIASISKYIFGASLRGKLCNTLHSICTPKNTKNIEHAGPIFAISRAVKNDLQQNKGLEATVVHNGILPRLFAQRPERDMTGRLRMVQVGRLNHTVKGQDILLQALAKVLARGKDVDLTLIGDGPSAEFLKEMAKELGVADRVTFLGNKPQEYIFKHLAEYDLMVQTSRIEGFGLTVAEAMAAMLPVVVADNAGPMEIIDGGRFGGYFPSGDADACADRIVEVINDYPTRQALTDARDCVIAEFNVETTARRYLALYSTQVLNP